MKEVSPNPANAKTEVSNRLPSDLKEQTNLISLNPTSIIRVLVALALLLLLINIAYQLAAYVIGRPNVYGFGFFYFDSEDNLPTAYSIFLILISTLLLTIITIIKRNQAGAMVFHWKVLTAGFLLMAMDEELSLHEQLNLPIREVLGYDNYGVVYFAWVLPAIVLVIVLGLFFLKFLMRLPAKTRLQFVMAGILYIGGSIGVELIGGRFDELYGHENLTYSLIATCEESLEMAGLIVFIRALLVYIADTIKDVQFRVEGTKDDGS